MAGLVGFRFLLDSGLHVADAVTVELTEARAACDVDDAAPLVTAEGRPGPVVRNCEWQWQRARAAPEAATIVGGFGQVGRGLSERLSESDFPVLRELGLRLLGRRPTRQRARRQAQARPPGGVFS